MDNFLNTVVKSIYKEYKKNLSGLCLVFPNRRASLYFNKHLSVLIEEPVWTPKYYTIVELFQSFSDLQLADNIYLIFRLYEKYNRIKKSLETFDSFYHWGEMLLNDFDEIDKFLINPKDLFQNLKNLKAIQDSFQYLTPEQIEVIQNYWKNFTPEKYSKHQQEFISVWEILYQVYIEFKESIKNENMAYEGMICREVINNIERINFGMFDKFIFIGFNAINECEKKLFKYLRDTQKAQFYWDYDDYYVLQEYHEAGYFIRKNIKDFPDSSSEIDHSSLLIPKTIDVVSVSSDQAQAEVIKKVVKKIPANNFNETAIVLADEQMLIPVLHNIPDEVEELNVSMGYPLQSSSVYSLFENLVNLQKNVKILNNNRPAFYYNDVLTVLNHQYIQLFAPEDFSLYLSSLMKQNKVYLQEEDFLQDEFFIYLFSHQQKSEDISLYLLEVFRSVALKIEKVYLNERRKGLEKEFIYSIFLSVQRINEIIKEYNVNIKIATYIRLLRKIIRNIRIPFVGEPLKGLQILGILETRTLDFKNIIILSLNEGIWPKTISSPSFIPYNLRKGFGLPTIKNHDAIYSYNFYRLIQRAENITLVYSTKSDGITSGEMSRFIYQLKYSNDFSINELNYDFNIQPMKIHQVTIQKNEEVYKKILKISGKDNGKYLSPSAINTYIDCRLKFYFKYIAGIDKPDEISEEVEALDFGNILHSAIYQLYKPYLNTEINSAIIKLIAKDKELINNVIEAAFQHEYFKTNSKTELFGRNLVLKEVVEKYLRRILEKDNELTPFKLLFLEENFTADVNIDGHEIKLGGKFDRVDEINGTVRIVDYKTGKVELEFKEMEDLFLRNNPQRNKSAFQIILYAWLYQKTKGKTDLIPSLYFIRKLFTEDFSFRLIKKSGKNISYIDSVSCFKNEFENQLINVLKEIVDKEMPFDQCINDKICTICPYKIFCQR